MDCDGKLLYGAVLDIDQEFPWGDSSFEEWWVEDACGWTPPFEIYDESGNYINGIVPSEKTLENYYKYKDDFENLHPCPVELEFGCMYGEDSILFLCIANKHVHTSYWGDPVKIMPDMLAEPEGAKQVLLDFCEKFGIALSHEPGWYLTSLYG